MTDCPICLDVLEFNNNCVTTECGHCFHAKCLMNNISHNGFACPCCRAAMAETKEDENEDDDQWSDVEEDGDDEYALRGFRFLFENVAGEAHDLEDIQDEDEDEHDDEETATDEDETKPTLEFVTQKLIAQGVTVEQLIAAMLANHENFEESDVCIDADNKLYGKLNAIFTNYARANAIL